MSEAAASVVLVHGLWMRGFVFMLQRRWLSRRGFAVRTFSYPSLCRGIDANARALSRRVAEIDAADVHLVGHSLGGLVVLTMLAQYPERRVRRAVLMGSPCGGSHCARVLLRTPGLAALVGRSLGDWLARPRLEVPDGVAVGVLAGDRSIGLGRLIPGLPRPNDGVVALAETRLAAASDSITLPVGHSQMLVSPACADQVAAFLKTGKFSHA